MNFTSDQSVRSHHDEIRARKDASHGYRVHSPILPTRLRGTSDISRQGLQRVYHICLLHVGSDQLNFPRKFPAYDEHGETSGQVLEEMDASDDLLSVYCSQQVNKSIRTAERDSRRPIKAGDMFS